MSEPLKILSLGAGVQSSTVLLMSCRGVLPKLDATIFADTKWEPNAVYEHLAWLESEAEKAGIPVHRVTAGDLRKDVMERQSGDGRRAASIPLFIKNADGTLGAIRRQCTSSYKIEPIDLFVSGLIGRTKGQRWPSHVVIDMWFGISSDEVRRARASDNAWKRKVYPLLNLPEPMLPRSMSRADCVRWLKANYPERTIPRSACIGCPYHSDVEWRSIKSDPREWADAVEFDKAIRSYGKLDNQAFLHRSMKPLDEVDLSTAEERGQMNFLDECQGMCGV